MNNLEHARHSLAHLLAAAVLDLYPNAKNTIGPAIDNGFYYDFEFSSPVTDKELGKVEQKMRELVKKWEAFQEIEVSGKEAEKIFAGNLYKLELINDLVEKNERITLYYSGPKSSAPSKDDLLATSYKLPANSFLDLCRGGHIENPSKDIPASSWKLSRIAGAYWRGDEKNKMLTRIYGLAFESKDALEGYEKLQGGAKQRDHKQLGRALGLFTCSGLVGAGLPLWTPKGTLVRTLLDDFVSELRQKRGYMKVEIPHITKKELYEVSGHWDKFKDELFRITTREGHEFAMKPMNCPHHTQIYARKAWSYRELPQRYANTTTCYRDEQTGELSGLSRVRAFAQDDAHVFCRLEQTKEEFLKIWDIIQKFYSAFGFTLRVRLSLHDPEHPEKYLGDKDVWAKAEGMLREIAHSKKIESYEGVGEAAFYGPKLDFMAKDAIGRDWQVATIQLDMNMPERFGLSCTNEKGEKERIVMIHAAIMGSIERFLSILIEHTAGVFPAWLSPVQIAIAPISEKFNDYASEVAAKLREAGLRVELDLSNESLGKKIRQIKLQKIPYWAVIGEKEVSANALSLEGRNGIVGSLSVRDAVKRLTEESKNRQP